MDRKTGNVGEFAAKPGVLVLKPRFSWMVTDLFYPQISRISRIVVTIQPTKHAKRNEKTDFYKPLFFYVLCITRMVIVNHLLVIKLQKFDKTICFKLMFFCVFRVFSGLNSNGLFIYSFNEIVLRYSPEIPAFAGMTGTPPCPSSLL